MAQITDPDFLHDGATDNGSTEVFIDTSAKTIDRFAAAMNRYRRCSPGRG